MPKHIDFLDFVLSRSFKGYSFNQQKMLVEGKYCLEANETAQISEQGLKMGFSSKREVEKEINSIIKGVDIHGLYKNVSELRCLDCMPGTIVDITFEYDMKASLLYLGDFVFMVCMDSSGFLHYNDRLTAIAGGFCTSSSSYFLIKRDGVAYPSDDKVLRLNISAISYTSESYAKPNNRNLAPACEAEQKIYAWFPMVADDEIFFNEESLTIENTALFCLDMTRNTISLNENADMDFVIKQCRKEHWNVWRNIFEPICNIDNIDVSDLGLDGLICDRPGEIDVVDKRVVVRKRMFLGIKTM